LGIGNIFAIFQDLGNVELVMEQFKTLRSFKDVVPFKRCTSAGSDACSPSICDNFMTVGIVIEHNLEKATAISDPFTCIMVVQD